MRLYGKEYQIYTKLKFTIIFTIKKDGTEQNSMSSKRILNEIKKIN